MSKNGSPSVRVDDIRISLNRRAIDEAAVTQLAASMKEIGLQHPITVRFVKNLDDPEDSAVALVAGHHRLEAARRLGWDYIDCIFQSWDERQARMWEIAENLHRAELSVLDRSEQVAEWAKLESEKPGQVVQVSTKGGRGVEGGISKAARELPVSGATPEAKRKTVARAIKIAGIAPDAKDAAVAAGLGDNQSALLKIAAEPVEAQVAAVAEVVAGPKSVYERLKEIRETEDAEPVAAAPEAPAVEAEGAEPKSVGLLRQALLAYADEIASGEGNFGEGYESNVRQAAISEHLENSMLLAVVSEDDRITKNVDKAAKSDAIFAAALDAKRAARVAPPADYQGEWRSDAA